MNLFIANIMALAFYMMPEPVQAQEKPDSELLFSFGVVADVQYSDYSPGISRFYRGSLEKLTEALAILKTDSADFVVNLGDLIDKDMASYDPVMKIIKESGLKTYHVAGNHDYSVKPGEKKSIPVLPEGNKRYYSVMRDGFRLIFLDGNDVSLYGPVNQGSGQKAETMITEMRKRGEMNALDWNGAIGSGQMKWLESELKAAAASNERSIIFCHFPIAPDNAHNLLNYKEVLGLISKFPGVAGWFCGHNHEGNYIKTGNIHHVNFMGMVETESENSFALVKLYADRIEIRGYGRETSRILDL
ncbi:MAG: metallophosphoesterase [Bacteroidales bacterium]|nr:metallophosphoesterase [Bacteroidales bacterium]